MKNESWEIEIECKGKLHRIGMNPNGQLCFLNHKKRFENEEQCQCQNFLSNWQKNKELLLPKEVYKYVSQRIALIQKRYELSFLCVKPLMERLHVYKTQKALRKTLSKCKDKILKNIALIFFEFADESKRNDSIWDEGCEFAVSYFERDALYIENLPYNWLGEIYQKGLALINGMFVTNIVINPSTKQIRAYPLSHLVPVKKLSENRFVQVWNKSDVLSNSKTLMEKRVLKILNCNNELHTIGLNPKGQFCFFNHPKGFKKTEQIIEKFGGVPCECYQFVCNLIKGDEDEINYDDVLRKHATRILEQEMRRASFPYSVISLKPFSFFSTNPFFAETWYETVYKKGLARIMGQFIATVDYEKNGKIYVYAINKQKGNLFIVEGSPNNYWLVSTP